MVAAGRVAAHVFVDDLEHPYLTDDDQHHLQRVLRLRAGELITVSDGHGRRRPCEYHQDRLQPVGDVTAVERLSPAITIGFALVKGDRPEWIIQKLTEVGVDRIVPFRAERSVVRWDAERAKRQQERWATVAREAAMQSRRCWLPELVPVADFAEVASVVGVALADAGGVSPNLHLPTLLVGPEGGWSERERSAGLPTVGLGPHVLRAETAAIVAGALLVAIRAGLVSEASRGR